MVSVDSFAIALPFPPSINHYYGVGRRGQRYLKDKGLQYRREVLHCVQQWKQHQMRRCAETWQGAWVLPAGAKLKVGITAHPPNKRRRDLDNLLKALLDALQAARVFDDDANIMRLEIGFGEMVVGGEVVARVEVL